MPTYVNGGIARCIAVRLKGSRLSVFAEYDVPGSDAGKWKERRAQGTAP